MIELDAVSFGYGKELILEEISVDISTTGLTCVLGRNGTGKSTLLAVMTGRLKPSGGTVKVDGTAVSDLSIRELSRRIAFIPQSHHPVFAFPCADVVSMGMTSRLHKFSAPTAEDRAHACGWLERLGVAHLAERSYLNISGGERQLVLLAAALNQEAQTIILDEPTAPLDPANSRALLKTLTDINKEDGVGIILTTHTPEHALYLGGSALLLGDRGVQAYGASEDVVSGPNLSALYGVDMEVTSVHGHPVVLFLDGCEAHEAHEAHDVHEAHDASTPVRTSQTPENHRDTEA